MRHELRRSLLDLAGRIRVARQELDRAEEEVEALLGEPAEPAAITAGQAMELGEALGTSPGPGPLRDAMLAVTAGALARAQAGRKRPSTTARVLAVLLEEPDREFNAAAVARRARCSEPVARTILSRLVQQGHAQRCRDGSFRARRGGEP